MRADPVGRPRPLPPEAREEMLDRATKVLARHPEILFGYAHGSFVHPGPYRDLDLAVYLVPEPSSSRFLYEDALGAELTEALSVDFPVDVRIANGTPLAFQHQAYRGRLLLDRDPERRAAILAYIASRYLDIKPILEHHAREAFGHDP